MSHYETHEQQASYGIGRQMGDQLASQSFEGLSIEGVQQGLADALRGEGWAVEPALVKEAFSVISQKMQAAHEEKAKALMAEGEAYLEENAKRDTVKVTESGLQYEIIVEGEGAQASRDNTVRVHYHGMLVDGTVFDSSVARGEPAEFPVTGVIAGWVEALQMMRVGDKYKLHIPHNLAYGERGAGAAIPPYAALVFDVELLDIVA